MAVTGCDKAFRIFHLLLNALLFLGTLFFNGYGITKLFSDVAGNRTNTSHRCNGKLDIIPAPWTFISMWSIIYLFQAAIIVYSLVNIFRPTPGGYLYYFPDILPFPFLLAYMGNWLCNSSWILVANRAERDETYLPVLSLWLWLLFGTLATSLVFSYRALDAQKSILAKVGLSKEYYVVVGLVQNGVSAYATWSAFLGCLNVGIALSYDGGMDKDLASFVSLVLISALFIIYVSAETFVLDDFTRFVFTPHCTLVFGLSGMLARHGIDVKSDNSVFVLAMLITSSLFLIVKIVVTTLRSLKEARSPRVLPIDHVHVGAEKQKSFGVKFI